MRTNIRNQYWAGPSVNSLSLLETAVVLTRPKVSANFVFSLHTFLFPYSLYLSFPYVLRAECVSVSAFTKSVIVRVFLGCVRLCVLEMREQTYTPWRAEPNSCSSSVESLLPKFHRKWNEIIFSGNRVPSCTYVALPLCFGRHVQTSGGCSIILINVWQHWPSLWLPHFDLNH